MSRFQVFSVRDRSPAHRDGPSDRPLGHHAAWLAAVAALDERARRSGSPSRRSIWRA